MIKFGIKLWTINKNWFKEAADLFEKKQINFIELYIVPDSFKLKELEVLKKIPVNIHSPHYEHNFNIFNLNEREAKIFNNVIKTADFLGSKHIILHAGIGDNLKIFEENYKKISDDRIIIENMPKIGLNNKTCFGCSLDQLNSIKNRCRLKICFDIGHAIKSAISQKINYKKYLRLLIKELKPNYFHICNGKLDNGKDEHLNLWEGDFDLKWIKNLLSETIIKENIQLVFEVPKNKNNLKNDLKNIEYFKKL